MLKLLHGGGEVFPALVSQLALRKELGIFSYSALSKYS